MTYYCPKCGQILYQTEAGWRCTGCHQLWALSEERPVFLIEVPVCLVCHDEHLVPVEGQCSKG